MIKRFASHFIFLPGHGYLKQYVVGVEEGQVVSAFPLTCLLYTSDAADEL